MLDILDVINEATKEASSFENHAAKELTLEERLLYLQGLALVMNADGEIHPEEKEYIRILIKSFEMDESILDSFVEFAQRPDKDTVQAFFRTFRRRPIAQLFLFDALMMTRRDDSVDEREKAVVDKIAEQLEVRKGTYNDIFDLFCHIKNKDWDESAIYFSSYLLNPEHFKHLLDYFDVDFDKLMIETKDLKSRRVKQIIQSKLNVDSYEWERLEYNYESKSNSKITSHYVNLAEPLNALPELMVIKIQSDLSRGKVFVNPLGELENKRGEKVGDLKSLGLIYNKENKNVTLFLTEEKESNEDSIFSMISYLSTGNTNKDISINDVIAFIFQDKNATLASARRHPSNYNEICFPMSSKQYINEILAFEGKFYFSKEGASWVHSRYILQCEDSIINILKTGKIRVVIN